MTAPAIIPVETLPALVDRASRALASARTSAEVLDARDAAAFVYDAAKAAARFAKAKGAHDELIAAVHRAQADALEIEAQAKRRLADEYDAAQERGEVVGPHNGARNRVPQENAIATVSDLGLTRKAIHEARQLRDAEAAAPGVIRRTLDARLAEGQEPTKAAIREAVSNVIHLGARQDTPPSFAELDRQIDAEQAAEDAHADPEVDLDTLKGRAHAINGSLSTIALISITGAEYWSVFNRDPARQTYAEWVRDSHRKLTDILKEIDNVRPEAPGTAKARRRAPRVS